MTLHRTGTREPNPAPLRGNLTAHLYVGTLPCASTHGTWGRGICCAGQSARGPGGGAFAVPDRTCGDLGEGHLLIFTPCDCLELGEIKGFRMLPHLRRPLP